MAGAAAGSVLGWEEWRAVHWGLVAAVYIRAVRWSGLCLRVDEDQRTNGAHPS